MLLFPNLTMKSLECPPKLLDSRLCRSCRYTVHLLAKLHDSLRCYFYLYKSALLYVSKLIPARGFLNDYCKVAILIKIL